TNVADNANDFVRSLVVPRGDYLLADRILIGPVLPCHAVTDDHAPHVRTLVHRTEQSSANEANAHRLEIVMRGHAHVGDGLLTRLRFRPAHDLEAGGGAEAVERKEARATRRLDARDRVDLLEQLVVERAHLLRRVVLR